MRDATGGLPDRVRLLGTEPGSVPDGSPREVYRRLSALSAEVLAVSRTTKTAVVQIPGGGAAVRKQWRFPEPRDRLRGAFRTTFLARSPASRAWRAMRDGGPTGFHPPALAAFDDRRGGVLHECLLLLTYIPGARDLAIFLRDERDPASRHSVLTDLAVRLRAMHDAGVADGEMHPRNVLVAEGRTYKVDCARQRRFAGGAPRRRRAHDLACLDVGLLRLASRVERARALRAYARDVGDLRPLARRIEHLRRGLAEREERRLPSAD